MNTRSIMQKLSPLSVALALGFVMTSAPAHAGEGLTKLSPLRCNPLAQSTFGRTYLSLPATWDAFKPYVRVCPMQASPRTPAKIALVTIFAEAYLAEPQHENRWPEFPLPLIVDQAGTCLAKLPQVFPFDTPNTLTLRFGKWVGDIPGEIRIHVISPTLGGSYDMPTLKWDAQEKRFTAENDTKYFHREEMKCPN